MVESIPSKLEVNEWERESYKKTGNVRWESILHFVTIDCTKAGFMRKKSGGWYLTAEGEAAIDLGAVGLIKAATSKYREWDRSEARRDRRRCP